MSDLTLVTNAVVAWTTEYYGLAMDSMRAPGRLIDDDVLAHISPAHSENINFFGAIDVDIDAELAQLGPTGYRPLRVRDTLSPSRGTGGGSFSGTVSGRQRGRRRRRRRRRPCRG